MHQSVLELIHSEDREEFRRQLSWRNGLPLEMQSYTLNELMTRGESVILHDVTFIDGHLWNGLNILFHMVVSLFSLGLRAYAKSGIETIFSLMHATHKSSRLGKKSKLSTCDQKQSKRGLQKSFN